MATSPFKSFIPFTCNTGFSSASTSFKAADPSPSSWRSMGLVVPIPGDDEDALLVKVEVGSLMMVQINERILPGKVRDEELKKRVAKLEAAEGRKVSKKEYAELRDQTEFDLLPRAFIRRSNIPVFFCRRDTVGQMWMLVFTSSQKKADDVLALLKAVFGDLWRPQQVQGKGSVVSVLTDLVKNDENDIWTPGRSGVLKGSEKRTVRVKDGEIVSSRIIGLILDGYEFHEVEILHGDEHSFVVNDNLCFKRVEPAGIKDTGDFYADAVVRLAHIKSLVQDFFRPVEDGGLIEMVERETEEDDEEL
jgi:recombination associated protein RdgC